MARRKPKDALFLRRRRAMIDAFKLARGCVVCGFKEHPAALQFDHPDPNVKDRSNHHSALHPNWSLARIQRVFDTCDVVCANHHAIRTASRGYSGGRPVSIV